MRLTSSHDSGHEFSGLTWVELVIFFLILFFSIELIGN